MVMDILTIVVGVVVLIIRESSRLSRSEKQITKRNGGTSLCEEDNMKIDAINPTTRGNEGVNCVSY